jgi:hypothetical protein
MTDAVEKGLRPSPNSDSDDSAITALEAAMMGRRDGQWSLFYQFQLDERVPKDHLLERIDRFVACARCWQTTPSSARFRKFTKKSRVMDLTTKCGLVKQLVIRISTLCAAS